MIRSNNQINYLLLYQVINCLEKNLIIPIHQYIKAYVLISSSVLPPILIQYINFICIEKLNMLLKGTTSEIKKADIITPTSLLCNSVKCVDIEQRVIS